jgi:hypothetical protein
MRYSIEPEGAAERVALWLGLAPIAAIDVLVPLLQARAIMAATTLGVFEAMRSQPQTARELAATCHLDPECLERLMRVLASSRYVRQRGERYRLTSLAKHSLLRGSKHELCAYVELNYAQWTWIEGLETTLKTGRGVDIHESLPQGAHAWSVYQRAMLELARPVAQLLARHVPVRKGAKRLLDLGGSHGLLGAAICRAHPPLRSTVVELAGALPEARRLAAAEGIEHLVVHEEGDITTSDLGQADVVLLSNVLHHLTGEQQQQLILRAFAALPAGGTLAIWETEAATQAARPELARDAISLYFYVTSSAQSVNGDALQAMLRAAGFERLELLKPVQARGRMLLHARKPRA